jgi:hypothetical protein
LQIEEDDHCSAILELISSKIPYLMISEEGELIKGGQSNSTLEFGTILSGSFNPLHEGHIQLLKKSSKIIYCKYIAFEISIYNADKPPLNQQIISKRISQFSGYYSGI